MTYNPCGPWPTTRDYFVLSAYMWLTWPGQAGDSGDEGVERWGLWHILSTKRTFFNIDNTIFSLTSGLMLQYRELKPEQLV